MLRRDLILAIAGLAPWSVVSHAQKARKQFRIGYLAGDSRLSPSVVAPWHYFVPAMEKLGYIHEKDFVIESRFADLNFRRLRGLALELVEAKVDVIVATTQPAVRAAQQATSDIPIVMAVSGDPVRMGLVTSLARPGGNTTGLSSAIDELYPKHLELLGLMVPNLTRVGFLVNPTGAGPRNPYLSNLPENLDSAARHLGITIQRLEVSDASSIEDAFAKLRQGDAQAVMVNSNPLLNSLGPQVSRLALTDKLPSISFRREYAYIGGLMSYGESAQEFIRRTAYFVDRILMGAKPAELPIELPTRFHFVINQKTAKALGLTIPTQFLATADDIIE